MHRGCAFLNPLMLCGYLILSAFGAVNWFTMLIATMYNNDNTVVHKYFTVIIHFATYNGRLLGVV